MLRPPSAFTIIGWTLTLVMFLYVMLIIVPDARANTPAQPRLVLELEDEDVKILEYETPLMICHLAVAEVSMIGTQIVLTCVRNTDEQRIQAPQDRGDGQP